MKKRNPAQKHKLLDEQIHAVVRHFYVRPSVDGRRTELSSSEFFACSVLGRKRRCTMTELAEECGLALSSMTGVIDRLVVKKCARRFRDEADRRRVFVELDKQGEGIYRKLLEGEMEAIIAMMDALEPSE